MSASTSFAAPYNESVASRLRLRSLLIPLSTLAFLAAQFIHPSPVWKALLAAFAVLWLITYWWARALRRNIRLERAMRFGWAQVGDKLEEQFVLHNEGFLPATWLQISDHSTLPGYSVARATGIEGSSHNSWQTSGTCLRRGLFTLGDTRIVTGDPLGLYEVEITQPQAVTLAVMPPVIPLPFLETSPGGWSGDGRPRPHAAQESVSAEAVRPYRPGDSLRMVHWPTTARRSEPYVRVLEGAPASDWWIALDVESRVQAGGDAPESTLELGVILAASLAARGLQLRRPVGLLAAGQVPLWLRAEAGEPHRWEIMRALAQLQAGNTPLAALLESAAPLFSRQANLMLITPSTQAEWVPVITKLACRGMAVMVLLIDPSTFEQRPGMQPLAQVLREAGITHHILGREVFREAEVRPGASGQWEWRVLPTGKAVPVRRPSDMQWKRLE